MNRLEQEADAAVRACIIGALKVCGGNATKAATLLGTPLRTVRWHIRRLGIQPSEHRPTKL